MLKFLEFLSLIFSTSMFNARNKMIGGKKVREISMLKMMVDLVTKKKKMLHNDVK